MLESPWLIALVIVAVGMLALVLPPLGRRTSKSTANCASCDELESAYVSRVEELTLLVEQQAQLFRSGYCAERSPLDDEIAAAKVAMREARQTWKEHRDLH